ncbi:MAG: SAM-dependent methyltransferase [Muribaculaceae bacterium]|nr:SAM-dependent methyltransferase [Muribaculaceae bacterium]
MKANLTGNLYGTRRCGVSHGDVFTSRWVVNFMLDLIGYTPDKNLSLYRLLEPSFGQGDFLIEIQNRIIQSAKRFNFDATDVMSNNIYGCEIDDSKYDKCIEGLRSAMPNFVPLKLKNEDFLTSSWDAEFDFIIGNPPYIRYENIPKEALNSYKVKFYTFHYRCDLYVLFYEHCLKNLSKNGRHCFICSNRWLKNEYGRKLRALISSSYNLEYIIDVEKLDVFKESVLAYPSITLISNTEIDKNVKIVTVRNLKELKLPLSTTQKQIRNSENWDYLFVSEDIDDLTTIEDQGFKVGIGVATGADKIFISTELEYIVEKELLLPIVNAKDLTGNEFRNRGLRVLNPYDSSGNILDLSKYPKAKKYLESFKPILESRHIVKKGRVWYSLIDKIKPQIIHQPKILLPDISGNNMIFIDYGSYYPAHNIYYITGNSISQLEQLAAVLMSKFVKKQIEGISNRMNGGFPRWQSQSIKRLRIPRIATIPTKLSFKLIRAYHNRNIEEIDSIVNDIIRIQIESTTPRCHQDIQKSLFDYDFSENIGSPGFGIQ